jgi:hypothetical protein
VKRALSLLALASLGSVGCAQDDGPLARQALAFVDPPARVALATDDIEPAQDGVQLDLRVRLFDEDPADGDATRTFTAVAVKADLADPVRAELAPADAGDGDGDEDDDDSAARMATVRVTLADTLGTHWVSARSDGSDGRVLAAMIPIELVASQAQDGPADPGAPVTSRSLRPQASRP